MQPQLIKRLEKIRISHVYVGNIFFLWCVCGVLTGYTYIYSSESYIIQNLIPENVGRPFFIHFLMSSFLMRNKTVYINIFFLNILCVKFCYIYSMFFQFLFISAMPYVHIYGKICLNIRAWMYKFYISAICAKKPEISYKMNLY